MASQADDLPSLFRKLDHANRVLSHCERVSQRVRRFVVECKHSAGNYIAEIDLEETDATDTVRNLLDGQFGRVVRVYELQDVSAEFAGRVFEEAKEEWLTDGVMISAEAAAFCLQHGVDTREIEEPAR